MGELGMTLRKLIELVFILLCSILIVNSISTYFIDLGGFLEKALFSILLAWFGIRSFLKDRY